MEKKFEIISSLASFSSKGNVEAYPIRIRIINKSSMDFIKAEVGVKDTASNQHAIAYFGHIASKTTAQEIVHLPGGIEFCQFKITPQVGSDITGGGIAGNAPGVDITITD